MTTMSIARAAGLGVFCAVAVSACGGSQQARNQPAEGQGVQALDAQGAPIYRVDPFWPKPLPNKWSMQQIVDIAVDRDDHVWIINRPVDARPDEVGAGSNAAAAGVLRRRSGDHRVRSRRQRRSTRGEAPDHHPGWPGRLQTIGVDRDRNIYVSGTTPGDSIIKFSPDGKFLWDFGHRGPKVPANQVKMNNQQTEIFPPGIGAFELDEDAREIYITDGFLNKRVLVYDMDTGGVQARLGRPRHAAQRDHERAGAAVQVDRRARRLTRRTSRPRCTACTSRGTGSSTSASAA